MFMTIIEEKQLHFCRYPNVRRLRLVWWMCCNLSLLCLLHILVFYKILRMVGGQKLQWMFIICIYFISVELAFSKNKYYELIERTTFKMHLVFVDTAMRSLCNHWDKKLMFLWILQIASFTAALLAFVYFAINSACMNEEKNDKESSILFSKMMTNLPSCWIA